MLYVGCDVKTKQLSNHMLVQIVWPCLAVVGGMDTGFCLGKKCVVGSKDEEITGMIVSVPDTHGLVTVQDQVTAGTDKISRRCV